MKKREGYCIPINDAEALASVPPGYKLVPGTARRIDGDKFRQAVKDAKRSGRHRNRDPEADAAAKRQARTKTRKVFVACDSEGHNTGRCFTPVMTAAEPDKEAMAEWRTAMDKCGAMPEGLAKTLEFTRLRRKAGELHAKKLKSWVEHDEKWLNIQRVLRAAYWFVKEHEGGRSKDYEPGEFKSITKKLKACRRFLERHGQPCKDDIHVEHKSFLWGAECDDAPFKPDFLCHTTSGEKIALDPVEILNWLCDLRKNFTGKGFSPIFVAYSFSYDACMILAGLPFPLANQLQANQVEDDRPRLDGYDQEMDEQRLVHSETVFWDVNNELSFAISYRKGKMFRVGRVSREHYKESPIKNAAKAAVYIAHGLRPVNRVIDYLDGGPTTINDVIGFFQTRFLEAIELMQLHHTPDELKCLKDGKDNRDRMAKLPLLEVMRYQHQELVDLCRMMNRLRECFEKLGLEITRWQGAGALAEAIFKKYKLKDYMPHLVVDWDEMPPEQQWAHHGYFGGHIEQFQQGRFTQERAVDGSMKKELNGTTSLCSCDINSAYPHVLRFQPAMQLPRRDEKGKTIYNKRGYPERPIHGRWKWLDPEECTREAIEKVSSLSMFEIEWKCTVNDALLFPLPYRGENKWIYFPPEGRGRYFKQEVLAALDWAEKLALNDCYGKPVINIVGGFVFEPPKVPKTERHKWTDVFVDDDGIVYPFRKFIEEYYELRLKYKKEGNILELVLKLALNSLYGKCAQSIGGLRGIDGKFVSAPRTACPWVAGAITAGCKAMLIKAACKAPKSIVMMATDALVSREPLHIESPGKPLGGWEIDIIDRATFIKPGNYALAGKKGV